MLRYIVLMPHVSKKSPNEIILLEISTTLFDVLSKKGFSKTRKIYLSELLTKIEQLMLAKRIAIILLLCQDKSIYAISNKLKVSPSTVARISLDIDNGNYKNLCKLFSNNKDGLLESLEKILSAGMPPIVGKGRYKFLDR